MSGGRIVAVVLNYRRAKETVECLGALSASDLHPSRVMVIDNHSGDGSADHIRTARPDVDVVETGENLGFAGGMNVGLRRALDLDAQYALILNSDTLVDHDTVSRLVRALDEHPESGAATGTFTYHPETRKVWYAGGSLAYSRAHAVTHRTAPPQAEAGSGSVQRVTFLTGCAMVLRSSALRDAGLFDERYFMYLEDVELCARMLSRGFSLLYVPGATFHHRLLADEQTPLKTYFVTRNRLLFLETAPTTGKRLAGSAYVTIVLGLKCAWWALTDRPMASAALRGVQDYVAKRFRAGRGLAVPMRTADNGRDHAHRH